MAQYQGLQTGDGKAARSFDCLDYMKMVTHFTVTQCRPILMFYVGLHSYLELLAKWMGLHRIVTVENEMGARKILSGAHMDVKKVESIGSFIDCVQNDALSMITSFNLGATSCMGTPGMATAWGLPNTPINYIFFGANAVGLAITLVFVLVLVVKLCMSGSKGLGQGRYITFSYEVQASTPHKVMSAMVIMCCVVLLGDTFRFLYHLWQSDHMGAIVNFVSYVLLALLTLVYSAVSLYMASSAEKPFCDITTEKFQSIQFNRAWSSIGTDNSAFLQSVAMMLLQAKYDETKPLQDISTDAVSEAEDALKPLKRLRRHSGGRMRGNS